MDTVMLIVAVLLVCAAGCAIMLVWPQRLREQRTPKPHQRTGSTARGADAASSDGDDPGAGIA